MVEKVSRASGRYKDNLETLVPLVLAAVFSVLGLTGYASSKELAAGTLLTLALLSFTLMRERSLRARTDDQLASVDAAIGSMSKLFHELNDPVPYRVLRYEAEWEIQARDGSLAKVWQRKLIKFNQRDVVSLWFWSIPSGTAEPSMLNVGKVVASIPSPSDGNRRSLVALDKVYSRDEELQFDVERNLHDSFLEPLEFVSVTVADSTFFLFIKVTFPADRRPTDIRLTGRDGNPRPLHLEEGQGGDNRPYVKVDIPDPPRGVTYTVVWHW